MNKKIVFCFLLIAIALFFWQPNLARAMPLGTLLYRTSNDGLAYGYNQNELITAKKGKVNALYTGHAAIYVGNFNGEEYIAEALANGLQLTPAKYFINTRNGEELIAAKIPKGLSELERQKVAELAKILAQKSLGYDYDFKKQKGPESGDWTCVGFTEKLYESAGINNPYNLKELVYDPLKYAIDITPDGYDGINVYNSKTGDCLAQDVEFSKIAKKSNMLLPAPELLGYDAGLEFHGDRYFFIPYTQSLQPTLADVEVDIPLASDFNDSDIRGSAPTVSLILRWSFINNPISSIKQLAHQAGEFLGINKSHPQEVLALSESKVSTSSAAKTNIKTTANKTTKTTKAASSTKKTASTKKTTTATSQKEGKKATSSAPVKNSTTTDKVVSAVISKTVNPAPVALKKAIITPKANNSATNNQTEDSPAVVNNYQTIVNQDSPKHKLLIASFGHSGSGHWLRLYNPNNEAVDMAAENYRLEKAKTAVDPSIMVRLGNDNDGTYPGGVEIAAQTTYLLVDEEVEADLRAEADAVISNSGFSWGDSGYTLYLGTNAISSSDDQDIQDFVGFGDDAVYYESNPTLALEVNHYLERKLLGNNQPGRDSDDNQADFVLLSSEAEVVDNNDEEENDDNNSEENTPDDNSTSTDPISTSTDPITPEAIPTILIARIFATGDDDAVELYNPNDEAVDLAAVGYRLEKSKTSSDPSIIMRIGNDSDGTYPGGTIIGSHQTYLIARDEAGAVLKSKAQAIAATSGFTWDGDGYSLFLGTDAISGTDDADLVDLVGFGPSALYYEGSAAAAIGDNYILTRKASAVSTAESMANSLDGYGYDSGNNSVDFVLVGDGEEPDENDVDNLPFNQSQDSNGLIHLWHFDECFGANFSDSIGNNNLSGNWVFQKGLFGCGLYLPVPGPEIKTVFADKLDISQMTLSFWQQTSELGRIKARFYNRINPAADVSVSFSPLYTEITGLPSSQRFYGQTLPNDNAWHQMFWVIDSAQDTWRLYIDGQFVREGFFDVIFSGSYDTFSLSDGNGAPLLDEVALWNRALSADEIAGIYGRSLPFSPIDKREAPTVPVPIMDWSFDERQGVESLDSINSNQINLAEMLWSRTGYRDGGVRLEVGAGKNLSSVFNSSFHYSDLTFDFWFQKINPLPSSHGEFSLLSGGQKVFGLSTGSDYTSYQWEGRDYRLANTLQAVVPNDYDWHYIALTYDSYNYQLSYAVDGVVLYTAFLPWLNYEMIDGLAMNGFGTTIDDFRIWQGSFTADGLKDLYEGSKIE